MSIQITSYINGQNASSSVIRVTDQRVTVSWVVVQDVILIPSEYALETDTTNQTGYEIRIGTSLTNWGVSAFIGDLYQSGVEVSVEQQVARDFVNLTRGVLYYGQVRLYDDAGRTSDWDTFQFRFNTLPELSSVSISPDDPSLDTDIDLQYEFNAIDVTATGTVLTRWYRDGQRQQHLDNALSVNSRFLRYGDTWSVDVFPYDGYQSGPRMSTQAVTVATSSPVASNVQILPENPNENDILKADFTFAGDIEEDNSRIRWFVNDSQITSENDKQYVRLNFSAGDIVRCEVQPFDGYSLGYSISSSEVTILASSFFVYNIRINGDINTQNVSSQQPLISWDVRSPVNRSHQYASVRIGSFYGDGSAYSEVLEIDGNEVSIPVNTLERGRDYYVAVSVSDTTTFDRYAFAKFSTIGSRWAEEVSNSTGWTMETVFEIVSGSDNNENRQIVRISDGSKFAEIKIHPNRISLLSSELTESLTQTMTGSKTLTVAGHGSDIKVYLDSDLVIDGTGLFNQIDNERVLEFGTQSENKLGVRYYAFQYSTAGSFEPGISSQYNSLQFYPLISFGDVDAIASASELDDDEVNIFVAVNNKEEGSSTIYSIEKYQQAVTLPTVPRTLTPVYSISRSPDGKYAFLGHARGASRIKGYAIPAWDYSVDLTSNGSEATMASGWRLVQNVGSNVSSFDSDGLEIDTTFSNVGAIT